MAVPTEILTDILGQFESKFAEIVRQRGILREQIIAATEHLPDEKKEQIKESLGDFGTEDDSKERIERFVTHRMNLFLANMTTFLCGGDERVHDCLWRIGEEPLKRIEDGLYAKGEEELCTSLNEFIFVFDDIVSLDDRAIQTILREVDIKQLEKALLLSPEKVRQKIYGNVSNRVAASIKENLSYMDNVPRRECFAARRGIINTISRLAEEGTITMPRFEIMPGFYELDGADFDYGY